MNPELDYEGTDPFDTILNSRNQCLCAIPFALTALLLLGMH
jgi:hypothetical protein